MRADLKISLILSATNAFKSWERLDVGGIISHSFELEAKTKGLFSGATAVITFRFPSKAALQLCCEKHRIQLGKARCLFDQNMEGPVTYTIVIVSMRILHSLMIQSTSLHCSRDSKVEIRMGSD